MIASMSNVASSAQLVCGSDQNQGLVDGQQHEHLVSAHSVKEKWFLDWLADAHDRAPYTHITSGCVELCRQCPVGLWR